MVGEEEEEADRMALLLLRTPLPRGVMIVLITVVLLAIYHLDATRGKGLGGLNLCWGVGLAF